MIDMNFYLLYLSYCFMGEIQCYTVKKYKILAFRFTNTERILHEAVCAFLLSDQFKSSKPKRANYAVRVGRKTSGPKDVRIAGLPVANMICHGRPFVLLRMGLFYCQGVVTDESCINTE